MTGSEDGVRIEVKKVGAVNVPLPRYQTRGAAGMDLHAALAEARTIRSLERVLVPTGLSVAIPHGFEGQVRPRSGLAAKHGITVLNTPGTIDSDYRGEIAVVLVNLSAEPFELRPQERIAQIVFARHAQATLVEIAPGDSLGETARGAGGYGSTGR